MKIRPLLFVFLAAFVLNLLWENLHAPLYVHYQGSVITEYILLRAALFDALMITVFAAVSFLIIEHRWRPWFMMAAGVLFAVGLEVWALQTGRWEYTALMPIIPFINVGLSPAIQLGATGLLALWTLGTLGTGDLKK